MTTLFFICLGVGVGFVLLSVIFGQLSGAFDSDTGGGAASPFKPIVFAAFLTGFGGMGLIFAPMFQFWLTISFAVLSGLALAYGLFRFVITPLQKWQNTNTHEKQNIIGVTAKVSEYIPQGGFGKITYTYNDKIMSGPAKSEDGSEIARNAAVEIVYIEKNTYHVRKK